MEGKGECGMRSRPDNLGLSFVFLSAFHLVKGAIDSSQVCQEEKMDLFVKGLYVTDHGRASSSLRPTKE